MYLEQIAKMYGMVDYLDQNTGYIYHLNKAVKEDGMLKVPVTENGYLIGYAKMEDITKCKV
jgi:hypothetical protein